MRSTRRAWMLCGGLVILSGTILWELSGWVHNPNHGISIEQARAAAHRLHPGPGPGVKLRPGAGG